MCQWYAAALEQHFWSEEFQRQNKKEGKELSFDLFTYSRVKEKEERSDWKKSQTIDFKHLNSRKFSLRYLYNIILRTVGVLRECIKN